MKRSPLKRKAPPAPSLQDAVMHWLNLCSMPNAEVPFSMKEEALSAIYAIAVDAGRVATGGKP